jgi:hypothetical protein
MVISVNRKPGLKQLGKVRTRVKSYFRMIVAASASKCKRDEVYLALASV